MQSSIGKEFSFFVAFQSLKKFFRKLTQSLIMCWCLIILWFKQQTVVSFPFFLPKADIEMPLGYFCYKICFQKENLKWTSAGMLSTWLSSRSPNGRKQIGIIAECMFDKSRPQFTSAYFQETVRAFGYIFVDNHPDTSSDKQVLNDIFGSCRRYPT